LIKCENGLPYCKDVSDQSTKVASFLSHPELRFSFSADPRVRHTFWTQTIGYSAVIICTFTSNQMMVQRYMSVSSVRQAQAYVAS